jgi:hypothetical protein
VGQSLPGVGLVVTDSHPVTLCHVYRTGDVFVRGTIKAATVTASGTSTVTLSGVTQSVSADLQGISKLYVDAASGESREGLLFNSCLQHCHCRA